MPDSPDVVSLQQATFDDLPDWALAAIGDHAVEQLLTRAEDAYQSAWPDAMLVRFTFAGATFVYDTYQSEDGRESRVVAACAHIPATIEPRDNVRQRGYPLSRALLDAGYERGHLIARASGGGLDVNLFSQAWQINQGRTTEGKHFRNLEQHAARHPGALQLTRLIWRSDTPAPAAVHLLVATRGEPRQGVYTNQPEPRPPRSGPHADKLERLQAGTTFHRTVQTDFLADLAGATASPERNIRLLDARNGRVDLLIAPMGDERMAVVVEIKNTDWDRLAPHRRRPNLRAHIRQLQHYLDAIINGLSTSDEYRSTAGVLLYPRRPADGTITEMITTTTDREALMVVWHDETTWAR